MTERQIIAMIEKIKQGWYIHELAPMVNMSATTLRSRICEHTGITITRLRTGKDKRRCFENQHTKRKVSVKKDETVYSNNHFNARQILDERMGRLVRR